MMGDFTTLQFRMNLKKTIPADYLSIIRYMLADELIQDIEEVLNRIQHHPLFDDPRWRSMLSSFSDPADATPPYESSYLVESEFRYTLHVFSVFKNHSEIEDFFDWIHSYIDETWLTYIGTVKSDVSNHPNLIYFHPHGVGFVKVSCDEIEREKFVELKWEIDPVVLSSI